MAVGRLTWQVQGMTCQSCVRAISGVVGDMAGVVSVDVSLEKEEATAELDLA
ncbi:hypothetical protein GGI04_006107, partial [Coemansia thaxteri]